MAYDSTLLRVPDPTTTPAGPGFTSLGLQPNKTGLTHDLNSGGTISVEFAGGYFTIDIAYPELTPEEANTFFPMLSFISGGFTNVYLQLPTHVNPRTGVWDTSTNTKTAKGSITINALKDNEIIIPSWSSRGGDISPGDALKFDNSHKIYTVAYVTLVANVKTIGLNCAILEKHKIPTAGLEPNNILFRCRVSQISFPKLTARGLYDSFSVSFKENIL